MADGLSHNLTRGMGLSVGLMGHCRCYDGPATCELALQRLHRIEPLLACLRVSANAARESLDPDRGE